MNWARQMRGGTTVAERLAHRMLRVSTRQRVLILSFDSEAEALQWDAAADEVALRALVVVREEEPDE